MQTVSEKQSSRSQEGDQISMTILGQKFRVFEQDDINYFSILDVMGDQQTIAENARVSTGKGRTTLENDLKLSNRLIADQHTSPWESVEVLVELAAPLFVLREWDRHRTLSELEGAVVEIVSHDNVSRQFRSQNEMSARYVQMPEGNYFPELPRFVKQSKTNAQGGTSEAIDVDKATLLLSRMYEVVRNCNDLYKELLSLGIERGVARVILPVSQYSVVRFKANLLNWAKFLRLRLDKNAQWEIRAYASVMHQQLYAVFPDLMVQLDDHLIKAVHLTRTEADTMIELLQLLEASENRDENAITQEQVLQLRAVVARLQNWS